MRRLILLFTATVLFASGDEARPQPSEAAAIAAIVDPLIEAGLAETGSPGAAFVFVRGGRIVHARGYGFADLASASRADAASTVWPIASITKSITAIALLQLVDEGRIGLDDDINRHLRRLQVPAQGYGPLTLRHLLSHTAGLDELPGRQTDGAAPADMAEFLRTRLVRIRAPGRQTAYSTYGIMLAAVLLEDVTGRSYADQVRARIFRPAGMASARLVAVRDDVRGLATPYLVEDGQARPIGHEYYVSQPASSMVATAEDMGRLILAHLAHRRAGGQPLLSRQMMRLLHRQAATVHPALPGWSLGMQMDRVNGRTIAEHGGDIGGFASLLVVLPDEDAGFFIVSHGEGSNLRYTVRQALIDGLFPGHRPARAPAPRPSDAVRLQAYAGRYLSSFACHSCPDSTEDAFMLEALPNGTLSLWGQSWVPLRRDLFIRDDGARMLGFSRNRDGSIGAVSAGSWRVAERLPTRRD